MDGGVEVGMFLPLAGQLEAKRRFLFLGQWQHAVPSAAPIRNR
jgi:hypothetical protein